MQMMMPTSGSIRCRQKTTELLLYVLFDNYICALSFCEGRCIQLEVQQEVENVNAFRIRRPHWRNADDFQGFRVSRTMPACLLDAFKRGPARAKSSVELLLEQQG